VNVEDVIVRLKKVAKWDRQGPPFEKKEIINPIEKTIAIWSDKLS
jgi:AP-1-like factor